MSSLGKLPEVAVRESNRYQGSLDAVSSLSLRERMSRSSQHRGCNQEHEIA